MLGEILMGGFLNPLCAIYTVAVGSPVRAAWLHSERLRAGRCAEKDAAIRKDRIATSKMGEEQTKTPTDPAFSNFGLVRPRDSVEGLRKQEATNRGLPRALSANPGERSSQAPSPQAFVVLRPGSVPTRMKC